MKKLLKNFMKKLNVYWSYPKYHIFKLCKGLKFKSGFGLRLDQFGKRAYLKIMNFHFVLYLYWYLAK